MKNLKDKKWLLITILVLIYIFYNFYNKSWTLSLYDSTSTLMRLEYPSKDSCLSAGKTYYRDGSTQYKRFDCGYDCKGNIGDLTDSLICSPICDNYGCR